MEYNFTRIEKEWQQYWQQQGIYKVTMDNIHQPKCYVLDMFPYPSGAGLHVGHPLGYIASDIYARYKRLRGYNVLHPMGYDAFGLPAEQYAIETGQHPATTTAANIARYRQQLDNIGFSYDWSRAVNTSDPKYYKWTQWIFIQLFHSWYDQYMQQARPMQQLIEIFEKEGNENHPAPGKSEIKFDSEGWKLMGIVGQRSMLMNYRIAYLDYAEVWWCQALNTVLANDEVVNGLSERGGHPVEKRRLRQWFLRITEFAERLLKGLDGLDWTDAMKEMQRNWIGRSEGAEVSFFVAKETTENQPTVVVTDAEIKVFTTRPDTMYGVDFMVLAPEHELVEIITTPEQLEEVRKYKTYVQSRSERERQTEVKQISGAFTGAYARHPFNRRLLPIWISEYVLAGYGTGAIMAVPSGDERDHAFAKHFNIPITNIFGAAYTGEAAVSTKQIKIENSELLSGMDVEEAAEEAMKVIESSGIGKRRINYRLRDAGFSRQRYWGEPFPIIYRDGEPYTLDELEMEHLGRMLPEVLPHVENYGPGPDAQGPLANLTDWMQPAKGYEMSSDTMPGYAASSWYFLRYMDPHNEEEFASRKATDYWNQVDVYVGGTEHAVGHLLYSRMWTKALCDLGFLGFEEPFKKLVNQGMIQGSSRFIYLERARHKFISCPINGGHKDNGKLEAVRVPVQFVDGVSLDVKAFKDYRPEYADFEFQCEPNGIFYAEMTVEKMSKSKHNVVNPDDIVAKYGADTFRLYEMFLGPIEVSKPWDTQGIEGVHRFLKKFWRLYADETTGQWKVNDEAAPEAALRILHKTIKKVTDDIETFSYNTSVSQLMICVNELTALNCTNTDVLHALVVLISPFAPHIAEELWRSCLGHGSSVVLATWPAADVNYLTENSKMYGIAINGKTRTELEFPLDASQSDVEAVVLADAIVQKWLDGKQPKKVIYVKGRMINVVV